MAAEVLRTTSRVNILKKVKVGGAWKLCPAVLEASGKLKGRVRIGGRVESHPEGTYYIEWRQNGQRLREAICEGNDVRERARLKALEIEAQRAGIRIDNPARVNASALPAQPANHSPVTQPDSGTAILQLLGPFSDKLSRKP